MKKIKKNPDVDTSFLPDREREEEETKLREELRQVRFNSVGYAKSYLFCLIIQLCHRNGLPNKSR